MGKFNFGNQLFLETQELNVLQKLLKDEGFERDVLLNTSSFGIVKNGRDFSFTNFKVSPGTVSGTTATLNISEGFAFSKVLDSVSGTYKLRLIHQLALANTITIPDDTNYYWIKITPQYRAIEPEILTVDTAGNVTNTSGSGAFLSKLRGQPNFPTLIRLFQQPYYNLTNPTVSSLNTQEYQVLEVIDDNHFILNGQFQSETNLKYGIVGTFTPAYVPSTSDKYPFQYDDCKLEVVQEITLNTPPSSIGDTNANFFIYRVRLDTGIIKIEDKRNVNLWKQDAEFESEFIDTGVNPLIGIEKVTYDDPSTPLDQNVVEIAAVFRSTNYNFDTQNDTITILSGQGGKFKTNAKFTNGDFNGWRVYIGKSKNYCKIASSVRDNISNNITLSLDTINKDDFGRDWVSGTTYNEGDIVFYSGVSYICISTTSVSNQPDTSPTHWAVQRQEVIISPDVEEIELYVIPSYPLWISTTAYSGTITIVSRGNNYYQLITSSTNQDPLLDMSNSYWGLYTQSTDQITQDSQKFVFPINTNIMRIKLTAFSTVCYYNVQYRYKNNKIYSPLRAFPNDNLNSDPNAGYFPENYSITATKYKVTSDYFGGYLRLLQNTSTYVNFKNKIDLGDVSGIQQIVDLEATVAPLGGRVLTWTVGVDKQNIEILGSSTLTANAVINLSNTSARNGNRFYIYIKGVIPNARTISPSGSGFTLTLKQNASTILHTFTQDELNKGELFIIATFDSTISSPTWLIEFFDKNYNGACVFTSGGETVALSTNLVTEGSKAVLVVSGNSEFININQDIGGDVHVDAIRYLNKKYVNNLKLQVAAGSGRIILNEVTAPFSPTNYDGANDARYYGFSTEDAGDGFSNAIGLTRIMSFVGDGGNYIKMSDRHKIVAVDSRQLSGGNQTIDGTVSSGTPISFGTPFTTVSKGPVPRFYTITIRGTISKNTDSVPSVFNAGIALYISGSLVDQIGFIYGVSDIGLATSISLTWNVVINAGQSIEFKGYAVAGDVYDFKNLQMSILGISN